MSVKYNNIKNFILQAASFGSGFASSLGFIEE
jgi:hypothetical protein